MSVPALADVERLPIARPSRFSRTMMVSAVTVLVTAAIVPVSTHQLPATISFMPALLAVVAAFDILSVLLLAGDFRDRGDVRLLVMSCAYAWSLAVMAGYGLAFPGGVMLDPVLGTSPSVAPYLYVAWHTGFPLLLGAAWLPWPVRWTRATSPQWRRQVSLIAVATAVALGAALVAVVAYFGPDLPVLIVGLDTSRMTTLTAPVAVPLVVVALMLAVRGTREFYGPERWASVAILVCLCDLVLTYTASSRFSLGWYVGRTMTVIAAGVVLMAMLVAFRRIKARAEQDAVEDALTGLLNRRGAMAALEVLGVRARRADQPLGVVSCDLDLFKTVNDRYGHEAGDAVLAAVGRVLRDSVRAGDVAARVGGEEFLLLLPDTDVEGSRTVAEKVREAVSRLEVVGVPGPLTASLGVTVLSQHDADDSAALRRADQALYEAKHAGRDRVVVLLDPEPTASSQDVGLTKSSPQR
ncbi:sensor domain-containing diguanylate cyclase [Nocardioides sp.]|uniref:GGDEF domain-containing protein n=1 Tax=Nocardioides sp. TaxID=35761 RepID=UPI002BD6359E|nr:sensor domain-containing diguanylate cyclase [Nocardioides sp.]HXH81081.1 sensor domain-containing diguanylate cyclase [Nocardioides sp.]